MNQLDLCHIIVIVTSTCTCTTFPLLFALSFATATLFPLSGSLLLHQGDHRGRGMLIDLLLPWCQHPGSLVSILIQAIFVLLLRLVSHHHLLVLALADLLDH